MESADSQVDCIELVLVGMRWFLKIAGVERGIEKAWWFDVERIGMMFYYRRDEGAQFRIIGAWTDSDGGTFDEYAFAEPFASRLLQFFNLKNAKEMLQ